MRPREQSAGELGLLRRVRAQTVIDATPERYLPELASDLRAAMAVSDESSDEEWFAAADRVLDVLAAWALDARTTARSAELLKHALRGA